MKKLWITLACLLLVLSLPMSGCKKQRKKDTKLTDQLRIPENFKHIPADTPYVFADIKAIPYEELGWDRYLQMSQASLSTLRETTMAGVEGMPPEMVSPDERFMLAVLDELDGRMSPEGLKELGISLEGHFAFYGIGIFPALRMELADAKKFEAMIARIEGKVGEKMPTKTWKDMTFRYLGDSEAMLPVIITDNELLVGLTTTKFEDEYLSYLTGKKLPEKSLFQDNRLLAMQKQYEMLPYMSGYMDTRGLVDVLVGQDSTSLLARSLRSTGEELPPLSDACKGEFSQLSKDVPRVVFGYTEVTKNSASALMGVEVLNGMPQRMMAAKAAAPGYASELHQQALLSIAFGVDVDKFIEAMRQEAQSIGQQPYTCEELTWINESAEEFYFSSQQLPPFLRSVRGVSLVLSELDFANNQLNKLATVSVVRSANPQELFDSLKLFFAAQLGEVNLKPDGQAVTVPLPEGLKAQIPGIPTPHMAMTSGALGFSMGPGMQDAMLKDMKGAEGQSPVFGVTYDMSRFAALIDANMPRDGMSDEERQTYDSMLEAYRSIGPASFSFDVTERGFFMKASGTFIPEEGGGK